MEGVEGDWGGVICLRLFNLVEFGFGLFSG
jgi:hypothetical protein